MKEAQYGGIQMAAWGIAEAQFSEVVEEALNKGPQTITRSGREVAVVVSIEEWESLQPDAARTAVEPGIGTLADILLHSPLRNSGFEIPKFQMREREELF